MTDIQQWRRMIQPARVRTPATEIEDSDAFTSPTTPRKLLKPKFSSYFTHHSTTASTSKFDLPYGGHLVGPDYPWSSTREQPPPTDIEDLIDTVMCKLFEDPTAGLTARWTPHLMRIFESFRNLKDGQQQLLSTVEHDREKLRKMELAWDCERQDYKAEVKRLELILSKGKRGLAEVTLARQDSLLRRGRPENMSRGETLETVFEFLEKTKRYEDRAWSSQRGNVKQLPSPSCKLTVDSHHAAEIAICQNEETVANACYEELHDEYSSRSPFWHTTSCRPVGTPATAARSSTSRCWTDRRWKQSH